MQQRATTIHQKQLALLHPTEDESDEESKKQQSSFLTALGVRDLPAHGAPCACMALVTCRPPCAPLLPSLCAAAQSRAASSSSKSKSCWQDNTAQGQGTLQTAEVPRIVTSFRPKTQTKRKQQKHTLKRMNGSNPPHGSEETTNNVVRGEQVDQASNAGSRGVTESRLRHLGHLYQDSQAPVKDRARAQLAQHPLRQASCSLGAQSHRLLPVHL